VNPLILAQADGLPGADITVSQVVNALAPMLGVLGVSAAVALILTPVMRRLALANGIVDWPDAKRKAHAKPVAYLGGLAIFLGWLAGAAFYIFYANLRSPDPQAFPLGIIIGASAIVLTGLIDDIYGVSARVKIGGQLFAAAALTQEKVVQDLVAASFNLINITPPDQVAYWVGTAVVACMVVGGCNALNLIDGLDGLSSGVTAIACLGMLLICAVASVREPTLIPIATIPMVICVATIGAVAGFLPYNFNPASIFMGDTGSLLLGYLCVASILFMGRLDNDAGLAPLAFTAAIVCFAVPITDTSLAIFRRKLQGKPILAPDAQHIHHMIRRSGYSVKTSVLIMYAMGLIFAALGVTMVVLWVQWKLAFTAFFLLYGLILLIGYRTSCKQMAQPQAAANRPIEAPNADPPAEDPPPPSDPPAPAGDGAHGSAR